MHVNAGSEYLEAALKANNHIKQLIDDLSKVRARRDKLKTEHDELKIAFAKLQGEHAALVERTSTLTENIEKYRCDPYPAKIETLSGLATTPSEIVESVGEVLRENLAPAVADMISEGGAIHHDGDDPGDSSPHLDHGDVVAQAVAAG